MNIGINLLYLRPGVAGGTETYASELLVALAAVNTTDQFIVFVNRDCAEWPLPQTKNFTRVVCPISVMPQWRRYLYEQLQFSALVKKHKIDVLHSLGYVEPCWASYPTVVTIHDLNYRAFGSQMSFLRRLTLSVFVKLSAKKSTRVIAVSHFSGSEIRSAFKLKPERVIDIQEAARSRYATKLSDAEVASHCQKLRLPQKFMISFSSSSPHKNIPKLLHAYSMALKKMGTAWPLVLVGHLSSDNKLRSVIDELGLKDSIIITGYIEDNALQAVLSKASVLIFPSLYEGFGLPILEAMASGVPVVCSNRASLPEVAGDAALYFDPMSVDEMAEKIMAIQNDELLRQSLIERGFANEKRFSWKKAALETIRVYQEICAKS
jgi:glycosyltransferase involved in cell wall biosynthesis